jgi:L-glutamine---4-(methylsulfanyl)-2-oxobutanoate aminotransferase
MAGWRLGFVVGNAEIVERVNLLQDHARAGIFAPVQEAGVAALTGPQDSVSARVATYRRRRDAVVGALEGSAVPRPLCEGTFFVWIRLPDGWSVERLLVEERVAIAPGDGFGARGGGWARLSLAVSDERLGRGLERLRRAFARAS